MPPSSGSKRAVLKYTCCATPSSNAARTTSITLATDPSSRSTSTRAPSTQKRHGAPLRPYPHGAPGLITSWPARTVAIVDIRVPRLVRRW